jgi:uncharacterized protein YceK
MRVRAELSSAKLTLLSGCSTTSRTTDSEYLFGAKFFFHAKGQYLKDDEQEWSILTKYGVRGIIPPRL